MTPDYKNRTVLDLPRLHCPHCDPEAEFPELGIELLPDHLVVILCDRCGWEIRADFPRLLVVSLAPAN